MKNILSFVVGILATVLVVLVWRGCGKKKPAVINQDYYLISNQISKMNKMVVLEQNFSSFQTHKDAAFTIGKYDILPKEMVLYSTAKAQVSYDLSQMKTKVDSVHKKLIIESLPPADIKIFPETKIYFMNDYALNRFDQASLQSIMSSAKENMVKSIDKKKMEEEGRKQLMQNLNDLFVLAKALHYKIEDKTNQLQGILP